MKVQLIFFAFFVQVFTQSDLEIGEEIQKWEDYKVRISGVLSKATLANRFTRHSTTKPSEWSSAKTEDEKLSKIIWRTFESITKTMRTGDILSS